LLGHKALGLTDHGSVAGVVRGWAGQKDTGVRMIPGARVDLTDGKALLLYPMHREAWSLLTRLLSVGKARAARALPARMERCHRPCQGADRHPDPGHAG
jgi:error-prone DNA polymerase